MLIATPAADGRTIAAHLVERGRRIDFRISAVSAPFAVKDQLRARGYRWKPQSRAWSIDLPAPELDAELAALTDISSAIRPHVTEIDWFNRHLS